MTIYQEYAEKATQFLSLTGYTRQEFDALLPHFSECFYDRMETYLVEGKLRGKRKYGDYQNSLLPTIEDKLFFILTSIKTNNLQSGQGALFGISQPKANMWLHCLQPALNQALEHLNALPARHLEDVDFGNAKGLLYYQDGTERPIQRPSDCEKQKTFYSGKKKQHTVKNNVLSNASGEVIFLSDTVEGKRHDKKLADETIYALPEGIILTQDTGFQGFDLEGVTIMQPKKKPRGGELSDMEKHINGWIASIRIRVEHAIGGVKRYRIVKEKIRNWKKGFKDSIIETCCGLHNFRLRFRSWNYDAIQLHLFARYW